MIPEATEDQITFALLTGEAAVETAAQTRLGIDPALRQAIRTALNMIAIGRVSEVRLDPRDHGIGFSFEEIDEQFCGRSPECPELVVTAVTGAPDDCELQFAALPEGEGDELKSAPIRKSEIAGLSDLRIDREAVNASRGHLGL